MYIKTGVCVCMYVCMYVCIYNIKSGLPTAISIKPSVPIIYKLKKITGEKDVPGGGMQSHLKILEKDRYECRTPSIQVC